MSDKSLLKEILLYAAIMIIGTLALVRLDAFDALYALSRAHEDWELDEIALAVPMGLVCLALFAYSRSRELRRRAMELETARKALDETHQRLLEMAKDRENFIAVSCHELKSPLNGIIHSLDLLEMAGDEADRKTGFDLAKSAARGLKSVIDGVLEFSRLYNSEHHDMVGFSPRDMAESIRTLAKLQAESKELALDMTLDQALPGRVLGHEAALRLAILNLVGNSIKYTDKGTVAVALSGDERELDVTVTDTGIGIPADELGSIFDPYQRTSLASGPGIGLGLTIVRQLVDGMGGSISVSSTVGRGSEFRLRVPVAPA